MEIDIFLWGNRFKWKKFTVSKGKKIRRNRWEYDDYKQINSQNIYHWRTSQRPRKHIERDTIVDIVYSIYFKRLDVQVETVHFQE